MKKHLPLIIAALVLIIFIVAFSISINKITITGNSWYTSEQIESILFPNTLSRNSLYCFIKQNVSEKESIPFIQDYQIDFKSPFEVEIIVYEKSLVGYVEYMSSYMYFDKDGIVVESANERLDGIPLITGLSFGQITLNKKLPISNPNMFPQILNLTQVLSINEIRVDKIYFNSIGEASLYIGDVEVILGDSSNMNGKIAELKDMLPSIKGLHGTLYLDSYDPDDNNMMYSFKRK